MRLIEAFLMKAGFNVENIKREILRKSIEIASKEQGLGNLIVELRNIIPDISDQYSGALINDGYSEINVRAMHAFQMRLLTKAVQLLDKKEMTIVDIGDSSGNHLKYITRLFKEQHIYTLSVNMDSNAVEKIKKKGMRAIHCSAEELDLGDQKIDLFTSFEMLEHLLNPCIFLRRLALRGKSDYLLITVPYRQDSGVGLWPYRHLSSALNRNYSDIYLNLGDLPKTRTAEDEHIFEFSPIDWKMLMMFSGWVPIYEDMYYQYPKRHILRVLKNTWKRIDYEGFWGVILKKDLRISNIYKDWPN